MHNAQGNNNYFQDFSGMERTCRVVNWLNQAMYQPSFLQRWRENTKASSMLAEGKKAQIKLISL